MSTCNLSSLDQSFPTTEACIYKSLMSIPQLHTPVKICHTHKYVFALSVQSKFDTSEHFVSNIAIIISAMRHRMAFKGDNQRKCIGRWNMEGYIGQEVMLVIFKLVYNF